MRAAKGLRSNIKKPVSFYTLNDVLSNEKKSTRSNTIPFRKKATKRIANSKTNKGSSSNTTSLSSPSSVPLKKRQTRPKLRNRKKTTNSTTTIKSTRKRIKKTSQNTTRSLKPNTSTKTEDIEDSITNEHNNINKQDKHKNESENENENEDNNKNNNNKDNGSNLSLVEDMEIEKELDMLSANEKSNSIKSSSSTSLSTLTPSTMVMDIDKLQEQARKFSEARERSKQYEERKKKEKQKQKEKYSESFNKDKDEIERINAKTRDLYNNTLKNLKKMWYTSNFYPLRVNPFPHFDPSNSSLKQFQDLSLLKLPQCLKDLDISPEAIFSLIANDNFYQIIESEFDINTNNNNNNVKEIWEFIFQTCAFHPNSQVSCGASNLILDHMPSGILTSLDLVFILKQYGAELSDEPLVVYRKNISPPLPWCKNFIQLVLTSIELFQNERFYFENDFIKKFFSLIACSTTDIRLHGYPGGASVFRNAMHVLLSSVDVSIESMGYFLIQQTDQCPLVVGRIAAGFPGSNLGQKLRHFLCTNVARKILGELLQNETNINQNIENIVIKLVQKSKEASQHFTEKTFDKAHDLVMLIDLLVTPKDTWDSKHINYARILSDMDHMETHVPSPQSTRSCALKQYLSILMSRMPGTTQIHKEF